MPYKNEHAARLLDPETEHESVRRTSGSGDGTVQGVSVPDTIDVIWYITEVDGEEVPQAQALRFTVEKWTEAAASQWLADNEIKFLKFEPAAEPEAEMKLDEGVQVISDKPSFLLPDVLAALSSPISITPMIYLTGEIVTKGVSPELNIAITGVPYDSPLAGSITSRIVDMFSPEYKDRIKINCSGYTSGDLNPPWMDYKGIMQMVLSPYPGATVVMQPTAAMGAFPMPYLAKMRQRSSVLKHTTKLAAGKPHKMQPFKMKCFAVSDVAKFSGVAMSPGEFNGDIFSAAVIKASVDLWAGIPLVINHEDERDPYTAILGQVDSATWLEDTEELLVEGTINEPDTVELLNLGYMPAMSPCLNQLMAEDGKTVLEFEPMHLAFLVAYAPANPAAGVTEAQAA